MIILDNSDYNAGDISVIEHANRIADVLADSCPTIDAYIIDWLRSINPELTISAQEDLLEGIMEEVYEWGATEGVIITAI